MEEARALFRDKERTEFIVVTIPTTMAMAESERLAASLQKEDVPCKRIVVNQMVRPTMMVVKLCMMSTEPLCPHVRTSCMHASLLSRKRAHHC